MSLTGILLDVSASMESNIGSGTDEDGGPWARSIFKVIDDLIEHDVSSDDRVFALGVGASCSKQIFDVIETVRQIEKKEMPRYSKNTPATPYHINKVFDILEINGARNIRNWATVDVIQDVVSDYMAVLILMKLESDEEFLKKFVYEFLPRACRDTISKDSFFSSLLEDTFSAAVSNFGSATTEDIYQIVEKAKCYILKDVGPQSTFRVKEASRIIRGCVDEEEITTERSRELLEHVEPFIYGRTPLYESLDKATELFQNSTSENKLLFVLSDGEPTDGGDEETGRIRQLRSKLRKADVKVVSCFITKSTNIQPKQLYDRMPSDWEPGAKFLFSLSSKLPTQLLPRAILFKRGWSIDIANNETKLFIQVNHPDNLREACDMAQDVVCCPEALSDFLVSVDLDLYINQSTESFEAKEQEKATCYANASAAVLHLAMKRILGREGGYPDFYVLREEMIRRFGKKGSNTVNVLQKMCPIYRLRCHELGNVNKAKEAIVGKRPVIARFRLTEGCDCCPGKTSEWDNFSNFYKKNPTGILTEKELDVSKRCPNAPTGGHAVVLTSYNSKCLTLMNSWGSKWGDMGFFRVKNAGVLQLKFVDVYWTENDLTTEEKEYYSKYGSEVAHKLMTSLKGLQKAEYTCPECNELSLVTEFTGTLSKVECPKCRLKFSTNDDSKGNILALNMYLTSLSR